MRDVSERKQAEETLKQSEERLRQIADNVPDLIWAKDMDDRFIFVNQAMCNKLIMCGTQDEAIGKIDMFFAEREKKAGYKHSFGEICVNSDAITKKRKAPGRFLEDGFVRDKYLVLDVHKAPFLNKDGEMIGTVGCGRDVTEQKKMEEELLKAKKLESIGVLAGGIAHDYNNLLTAIIGNISLAQSYLKPDGEAFKLLSEAQKASMGAKDLTQKLITFSKGGTPIKKAAPISPLLKNTTELALSGSNIKCEWSIADDLWPIEIDEAQIGQVIHSLIINAREAMSEGGSIYVSAENISIDEEKDLLLNKGKHVKISIKDQGSGIPDKYLGKIFDPYFSTKQRSTQKGMGLGLSICHSIIKKHDGHITAESAPAAGTTFHFYLPASQTQVIEEEAPVTERPMASRGSILVMDDEELVRNVAGQMLTRLGYDVAFAKDGSEAIEMYKKAMKSKKCFDAVILDLTVKGGMGGKETVKKLLEIDSDVKAILSSGYSDDPAMTDFRKHAFCSTIVKPYDIDKMDRVIFEAIK
ncbi:MAG: response regulator [Deltaproteobacteria bacterium]|nr:response regulator [Deltaproteobacteria bacterium]